jgi:hypothetical protein
MAKCISAKDISLHLQESLSLNVSNKSTVGIEWIVIFMEQETFALKHYLQTRNLKFVPLGLADRVLVPTL